KVPSQPGTHDYVFLADIVLNHAAQMYRGFEIVASSSFRVTRNSNLYVQEEESRNLLESVHSELANRRKGDAVRLEIAADASPDIAVGLRVNLELEDWQVFHTPGPVNLSRIMNIYEQSSRPDLKFKSFTPRELRLPEQSPSLFEHIQKQDLLLHHP